MTGININKYIRNFVKSDERLLAMCPLENIKPLVLPPNKFPFISYAHGDVIPDYSKDGCARDNMEILFVVVSNDYDESIDIASEVRKLLENKMYEDDEVLIPLIRLQSVSEDFIENAYTQMLVFKIDLISKEQ